MLSFFWREAQEGCTFVKSCFLGPFFSSVAAARAGLRAGASPPNTVFLPLKPPRLIFWAAAFLEAHEGWRSGAGVAWSDACACFLTFFKCFALVPNFSSHSLRTASASCGRQAALPRVAYFWRARWPFLFFLAFFLAFSSLEAAGNLGSFWRLDTTSPESDATNSEETGADLELFLGLAAASLEGFSLPSFGWGAPSVLDCVPPSSLLPSESITAKTISSLAMEASSSWSSAFTSKGTWISKPPSPYARVRQSTGVFPGPEAAALTISDVDAEESWSPSLKEASELLLSSPSVEEELVAELSALEEELEWSERSTCMAASRGMTASSPSEENSSPKSGTPTTKPRWSALLESSLDEELSSTASLEKLSPSDASGPLAACSSLTEVPDPPSLAAETLSSPSLMASLLLSLPSAWASRAFWRSRSMTAPLSRPSSIFSALKGSWILAAHSSFWRRSSLRLSSAASSEGGATS